MRKFILACAACATFLTPQIASSASTNIGTLDCDVSAGIGVIIGSKQDVSCVFTPSPSGQPSRLSGTISEFGLDVGEIQKSKMVWLVYTANGANAPAEALQGVYRGVAADASLGLGVGAKILVGGTQDSVSLQPVSVEGDVGVNVAVGVESLALKAAN